MKLRHAAAVMLTGWFLITPPPLANGHYDPSAALSKRKTGQATSKP
jgi:hypothetical protein